MNPDQEAAQAIEEKRDLYECIVNAALAISEEIERILKITDIEEIDDE